MPIQILMPALSPTMEKGNLAKWHVKEGDQVKSGDVIAEIETDKATMEVEAVDEGTVGKILVQEGTSDVPVNQPIAVLLGEGEDAGNLGQVATPEIPKAQPAAPQPQPATPEAAALRSAPQPQARGGNGGEAPRQGEAPGQGEAPAPKAAEKGYGERPGEFPVSGQPAQAAEARRPDGQNRIFASPLARRLAKERGIDLARLQGSGPHGRIIKRDIEKAAAMPQAAAPQPAAQPVQAPAAEAPQAARPAPVQAPSDQQVRAFFEPGSYEEVPHDNMRRTIAQRLTGAHQTIPVFYLTVDCEIDALLALRKQLNDQAPQEGAGAYKLSVNDFVIKAWALALQKVPAVNASWTEGAMLRHKHSDIGIAVALEGGLITPVVRRAEEKTLSTISNEMKDFAARARARKLKPTEYQGGSTAISNLGMFGIRNFTAIINPPHASILAVGVGEQRAVVRGGEIKVATFMTCTMTCDHRVMDGATGAQALVAFKELVEKPMSMLV